ncbi:MAG: hypothetical protein JNJ54_29105 [Myxococcaceae bacterium]|nr:hypothetical protein [Myxococcaceae bacterium]
MTRIAGCLVVCLATASFASARGELLSRAADGLKDAVAELEDTPGACRKKLSSRVEALDEAMRAARKDASESAVRSARKAAEQAADVARDACPGASGKRLVKALDGAAQALDEALAAKEDAAPPPILGAIAQGLGGLLAGAAQHETQRSSSEWSKSSRTEQVNGRDVEPGADEEPPPAEKRKASRSDGPKRGEFGATCRRNEECDSNTCYVGAGQLGFCTKMCSEDDDCPRKMFEWSCYRPRGLNAPQKLCLQSKD